MTGVAAEVLDSVVAAETPEGVLLELRPAGLTVRFYAFAVDWLVRIMIMYAAATAAALLGRRRNGFPARIAVRFA
jgi:uncharacterized RDD family membrane protein YckC